jgi:hypothetical protein
VKADDIAPLFGGGDPGVGFHSGMVLEFDPSTGENLVMVAGAPLRDLPMLNIGDTTNLAVGDVVVLLKIRTKLFIVGRVVESGSTKFASASISSEPLYADSVNFAVTTSDATVVSATLTVPAWANRALVHVNHHLTGRNSTLAAAYLYTSVWITTLGAASSQNLQSIAANGIGFVSASLSDEGAVTPGSTILVEGRAMVGAGPWAASAFNQGHLTGFAIYTRV